MSNGEKYQAPVCTRAEAMELGRAAFRSGVLSKANPFMYASDKWHGWTEGWCSEKRKFWDGAHDRGTANAPREGSAVARTLHAVVRPSGGDA